MQYTNLSGSTDSLIAPGSDDGLGWTVVQRVEKRKCKGGKKLKNTKSKKMAKLQVCFFVFLLDLVVDYAGFLGCGTRGIIFNSVDECSSQGRRREAIRKLVNVSVDDE